VKKLRSQYRNNPETKIEMATAGRGIESVDSTSKSVT
jgi:hypothetical protein